MQHPHVGTWGKPVIYYTYAERGWHHVCTDMFLVKQQYDVKAVLNWHNQKICMCAQDLRASFWGGPGVLLFCSHIQALPGSERCWPHWHHLH